MKKSVYIETSVISYHEARSSRDIIIAARQTITHDWWFESRQQFDVFISALVIEEAKSGDSTAAEKRLELIKGIPVLEINSHAESLASALLDKKLLPTNSAEDALHIALATVHGIDFILTWNFRHINNAIMKTKIAAAIEALGFECPIICSPEELEGI